MSLAASSVKSKSALAALSLRTRLNRRAFPHRQPQRAKLSDTAISSGHLAHQQTSSLRANADSATRFSDASENEENCAEQRGNRRVSTVGYLTAAAAALAATGTIALSQGDSNSGAGAGQITPPPSALGLPLASPLAAPAQAPPAGAAGVPPPFAPPLPTAGAAPSIPFAPPAGAPPLGLPPGPPGAPPAGLPLVPPAGDPAAAPGAGKKKKPKKQQNPGTFNGLTKPVSGLHTALCSQSAHSRFAAFLFCDNLRPDMTSLMHQVSPGIRFAIQKRVFPIGLEIDVSNPTPMMQAELQRMPRTHRARAACASISSLR